jgi:hypothetical protein
MGYLAGKLDDESGYVLVVIVDWRNDFLKNRRPGVDEVWIGLTQDKA